MNKFFYDLSSDKLLEIKKEITRYNRIKNALILVGLFSGFIIAYILVDLDIFVPLYEDNNSGKLNLITASSLLVIPLAIIRFNNEIKKIKQQYQITSNRDLRDLIDDVLVAQRAERAKNYEKAISIWERMGVLNKAAELRTLMSDQGTVKVSQNVVHGDQVTKTEIKDSVLNRSNVGGGASKMQELKDLTEMKEKGLIDDDEFKQMKKEILGK